MQFSMAYCTDCSIYNLFLFISQKQIRTGLSKVVNSFSNHINTYIDTYIHIYIVDVLFVNDRDLIEWILTNAKVLLVRGVCHARTMNERTVRRERNIIPTKLTK